MNRDPERRSISHQPEHAGRFIGLGKTSSEKWITINIHDHQTNQSFLLDATLLI